MKGHETGTGAGARPATSQESPDDQRQHFLNLPGARVVATEQLLDTRDLVDDVGEMGAMVAV